MIGGIIQLNFLIHTISKNKQMLVLGNMIIIMNKLKRIKDIQLGNNKEINQRIIKSQGQVLIIQTINKKT